MTSSDLLEDAPQESPAEVVRHRQSAISWTTRLLVGIDVAAQRKSPWVSMTTCALVLAAIVLVAVTMMMLAGTSLQLIYAALGMFVAVQWWLSGRLIDAINYRRRGRPARPDEVAALRRHARPSTWSCVRDAAADWRRSVPQISITIAMILDWEDKAFRKVRAALPPTVAEQAAVRAQALAFE